MPREARTPLRGWVSYLGERGKITEQEMTSERLGDPPRKEDSGLSRATLRGVPRLVAGRWGEEADGT